MGIVVFRPIRHAKMIRQDFSETISKTGDHSIYLTSLHNPGESSVSAIGNTEDITERNIWNGNTEKKQARRCFLISTVTGRLFVWNICRKLVIETKVVDSNLSALKKCLEINWWVKTEFLTQLMLCWCSSGCGNALILNVPRDLSEHKQFHPNSVFSCIYLFDHNLNTGFCLRIYSTQKWQFHKTLFPSSSVVSK